MRGLGFRHPGKLGELVNDPPQITGLPDNNAGHLVQLLGVVPLHIAAKLAFDAFSRQLDGRERVLDFMGNAARNIAPGRHPLGADQIGHVIKGNHIPFKPSVPAAPCRHAHQQVFLCALPRNFDFALRNLRGASGQRLEKRREFGYSNAQRQGLLILRPRQKPHGRAVHKGHATFRVEPDNARCHRRQHGIEQAAAAFNLAVDVQQRLALAPQLPCHLIKVPPQHGDFIIAIFFTHAHVQITCPNLLRRSSEAAHGAGQPLRKPQPQPDRRQDQDQRKRDVEQAKVEQQPPAIRLQLLIEPRGFLGFIQQRQNIAVHIPAYVQIAVGEGPHWDKGAEFVVGPVVDQHKPVALGKGDVLWRRCFVVKEVRPVPARADLGRAINEIGLTQAALDLPLAFAKKFAVAERNALQPRVVHAAREAQGICPQVGALLALVGFGCGERVFDHTPHPIGKPSLKAYIDRKPGKHRNADCRDQRHKRKYAGQAQVQP